MKQDFDKLKKDAERLSKIEGRDEILNDLANLEKSEKQLNLLQAEMETFEAKRTKNKSYGLVIMFFTAIIAGWYVAYSIINGNFEYRGNIVSLSNDPIMFWLHLAFPIFIEIVMIVGLIYMVIPNPSIKRDWRKRT
jgi:uncharacterized BrkB/YihY/UPF0761 family membrane protein